MAEGDESNAFDYWHDQSSSDNQERDDSDSALGSDSTSISETISSSVMAYEYEHGRRYHAYQAGKYPVANDTQESQRLNHQHQICYMTLHGKLHRAPLDKSRLKNALDIGTGTGIWAIDFGDEYPDCEIIGTDLSPIQPNWTPPNVSFMVDDAEADQEWIFPPMDYIHSRLLTAGLKDWKGFLHRCYTALLPGAWLELFEFEFPFASPDATANGDNDSLMHWSNLMLEAGNKFGVDFQAQNKILGHLEDTGFVNITREEYVWPVGPWPEDPHLARIGQEMIADVEAGMESSKAFLTRALGWSIEEVTVLMAKCRTAVKDLSKHRQFRITVHYCQKPGESDV